MPDSFLTFAQLCRKVGRQTDQPDLFLVANEVLTTYGEDPYQLKQAINTQLEFEKVACIVIDGNMVEIYLNGH